MKRGSGSSGVRIHPTGTRERGRRAVTSGAATPHPITSVITGAADRRDWQERQRRYWGAVSERYDDLYRSRWSRLENAWVASRLSFVGSLVSPTVVDLGCGTGLGYRLLTGLNPTIRYVGVDISPDMTRFADVPGGRLIIGDMTDLSPLEDGGVDVVVALFTSASFAFRTTELLAEVSRVLRPGGHAYLSMLNAASPSRATRRAVRDGEYRTRGDRVAGPGAPVRFFRIPEITRLVDEAGLTTVAVAGMNAASGSWEVPSLWHVGRLTAHLAPVLAHTIDIHIRKFR
jgi:SAM-dependent methyltransferase